MSDAVTIPPKWGSAEMLPLPKRFNSAVRALTAERFAALGAPWKDVVFARQLDLFSRADAETIERDALAEGIRFEFSANASLESEPEKYKRPEPATASHADAPVVDGAQLVGTGDNVIRRTETVTGPVTHVSTTEKVMTLLGGGIPPGQIAVIDDAGGTLTAPIIEGFAGVICLGGTVRSHLGILAREYDVPTLMNATVDTLADGDVVEIEVTAELPAPDAYETGDTGHARIWKTEDGR